MFWPKPARGITTASPRCACRTSTPKVWLPVSDWGKWDLVAHSKNSLENWEHPLPICLFWLNVNLTFLKHNKRVLSAQGNKNMQIKNFKIRRQRPKKFWIMRESLLKFVNVLVNKHFSSQRPPSASTTACTQPLQYLHPCRVVSSGPLLLFHREALRFVCQNLFC